MIVRLCRISNNRHDGAASYVPSAHAVQHQVEQDEGVEDAWRSTCLPQEKEARLGAEVR